MAALGVVSEGLGNKVWMLVSYIYKFQQSDSEVLYIFYKKSQHEETRLEEIFPKLKKLSWLKFIYDRKEYDKIKKDAIFYEKSFDFDPKHYTHFKPQYFNMDLKILSLNPDYKPLLKKYDTKNGIVVHYRLGDKLGRSDFLIMKPEYFQKHVQKMRAEKEGPVYLASDSMSKAVKLLGFPVIPIDEDSASTFYLLTKFKRLILSESTFGIVARYLNADCRAVIPEYHVRMTDNKLEKSPYLMDGAFELEKDKSLRL